METINDCNKIYTAVSIGRNTSNNTLTNVKGAFWLEKPGEGRVFQDRTVKSVQGKGFLTIGNPPVDTEKDWVVVLQ